MSAYEYTRLGTYPECSRAEAGTALAFVALKGMGAWGVVLDAVDRDATRRRHHALMSAINDLPV
jgi:hypothetical protein